MLDTVTTRRDRRTAPQKASKIVVNLPGYVPGPISPYPMVVSVMTVNQMALKKLSNTGSSGELALKKGISNILMT